MKDIITYNKAEDSKRRNQAKNIIFEEQQKAAKVINDGIQQMINDDVLEEGELELVQKFVDNYQNLLHHKDTTCGIYGTNVPSLIEILQQGDNKDKFWTISF